METDILGPYERQIGLYIIRFERPIIDSFLV